MSARLYSRILLNTVERMELSDIADPVSRTSHVFPIPHPEPGQAIGIVRVLARLHVHNPADLRLGANEFTLALFRASDLSLTGGAVFETTPWLGGATARLVSADRETIWDPNHFVLAPDDQMIAVMEAFGAKRMHNITIGGFVAIAYARLRANGDLE